MVEALTGWLGVLVLVLAAASALAADALRQRQGAGVATRGAGRDRPVAWLSLLALVLTLLGAVATLVRFAALT